MALVNAGIVVAHPLCCISLDGTRRRGIFFGHLKRELLYLQEFDSVEHLKAELIEYMDYYNNRRIKASAKGLPPALHRQQALSAA